VAGEFDTAGQSTLVAKTYRGTLADKYYPVDQYDMVLTNFTTYNLFNFTAQEIAGVKGVYTIRFSQVAGDSLVAVVTRDGQTVAEVDVTDQLKATARYLSEHASSENEAVMMPLEQMTVQFENDTVRVRVVLKSVSATADKISRGLSTALTDIILIDEK
jgi:archaellum component FlaF (FlaF/FlaG flagellin family)